MKPGIMSHEASVHDMLRKVIQEIELHYGLRIVSVNVNWIANYTVTSDAAMVAEIQTTMSSR